jgi:hypothetical protein
MAFISDFLETIITIGGRDYRLLRTIQNLHLQYEKDEKIQTIPENITTTNLYHIYCYMNIGTMDIYIGMTKDMDNEEKTIEEEYNKYVENNIAKNKYDIRLLENIERYGIEYFKLFGIFAFYSSNDNIAKMVQQYHIEVVREYKKLINREEVYKTHFQINICMDDSYTAANYVNEILSYK